MTTTSGSSDAASNLNSTPKLDCDGGNDETESAIVQEPAETASYDSRKEILKSMEAVERDSAAIAESFASLFASLRLTLLEATSSTMDHMSCLGDASGRLQECVLDTSTKGNRYINSCLRLNEEMKGYVGMSKIALEKVTSCDTVESSPNQTSGCVHTDPTNSSNNLTMGISCNVKDAQPRDLLEHIESTDCVISSASSEPDCENTTLRSDVDSTDASLRPHSHDQEISMKEAKVDLPDSQIDQRLKFTHVKDKPQYALAKHEHAFAGAMSGIFVSLCLHPMDTIKTVIQSCRADQKSLHYVGRSIISERGLTGLYRGISSNIATSAPISAVYTFTYESVKKTLIPLLPKENHSFAHCMAGGCASIATSFIFTPSERIKQQMQVGSHYRNCWTALKEVVQRGGLPSLYTGWTAVLCRNIPHSIIKFYTYESLMQITLPSVQSNVQANTLATLFCGGLAGSMASLFTTPFDVVKTRLQTQIPGSMNQHAGVFHTLTSIGKTEGLKGLYRGLTPRLVMYMIQGALFFTSYESFKRCFSLDGHSSTE